MRNNKAHTVNEKFFSRPNRKNSYYAGFIAGDGNIYKRKNKQTITLSIDLHISDLNFLEDFKNALDFSGRIYTFNNRPSARLAVNSVKLCQDLKVNFNIGKKKSLTLKPPIGLNRTQELAYIAGLFDSDGCLHRERLSMTFLGTRSVMLWTRRILAEEINPKIINLKVSKVKGIYKIYVSKKNSEKILNLFNRLNIPRLQRKIFSKT